MEKEALHCSHLQKKGMKELAYYVILTSGIGLLL